MILETARLLLRPWEDTPLDAQELYRYAKDPQVGPIAGWPVHTSVENSRKIIRSVLSAPETYAVVLKATGKPVGSVGVLFPDTGTAPMVKGETEIGYWIGVPYWGQGLIPEAVREVQRHCFEDLGCSAVWCGYYDGNHKSQRAQEKCGFVWHHMEKDKLCALMGDIRTEHYTKITRSQWEKLQCPLKVRALRSEEVPAALELVWSVFSRFEAPEYPEEGIREFRSFLNNSQQIGSMPFYGAFRGDELIGVLAMRVPQHISLFFVRPDCHAQGVGTALFQIMRQNYVRQSFTVNSSPYAVRVYEKLGFVPTDSEQIMNGIRYTPMKFEADAC